ncbi:MAG: ATP-binding protein [Bacteroidetes bacterium]|nr:ATP-binding protein [Bacteroidota bacterium]
MRLRAVTVQNFRAYLKATTMDLANFSTIVGRNDVGKSTLLEALDIFFDNSKPDPGDANINAGGLPTRITCKFDELPPKVVLDAQVTTTLESEYLLNEDGLLEIVKEYDLGASKPVAKVFAHARHPGLEGCSDLLKLTNAKLKARAKKLGIALDDVDQRVNASLRKAIWASFDNLDRRPQDIPLSSTDGKAVWTQLHKELPTFALFRADRQSRDDDSEITDPFDMAVKDAVKELETEVDLIKEKVQKRVGEVVGRTLDKLHEMDATLAAELRPVFKSEPRWASFKLSLLDQNDVPINKRGSGVRRLILLNFFRAEAERRQLESDAPGIIYAIEEPESSQHPNNQRMLLTALQRLSEADGTQIIITTHVPGIAALVQLDSIRLIEREEDGHPSVKSHEDDVIRRVAEQLGVLADDRVRLLLFVEGPKDVIFFEAALELYGFGSVVDEHRVAIVPSGGGTLRHWIRRRYLRGFGLPEVHIYDRDADKKYKDEVQRVNSREESDWAALTLKREIENYFHPDAVRDALGVDVMIDDDNDVPEEIARKVHEASDSETPWISVSEEKKSKKRSNAKKRLSEEVMARMTLAQLQERDPEGEIEGWVTRIVGSVDGRNNES